MSEHSAGDVERFDLPRPDGQGVFVIRLSRPPGLAPDAADTPVVYMLDADIGFGMAMEIARYRAVGGMLADPIVVGVGYGADYAEMTRLRTGDLTPPLGAEGREAIGAMTGLIGEASGGADALLAFMIDTLAPEIARRVPQASASQRILFGHSLGGLFAAYALLTRPESFPVFALSSPSLWWDGFSVLAKLPAFAERLKALDVPPRVLVAVGAREQEPPTKPPPNVEIPIEALQALVAQARMVDAAAEFAVELRRLGAPEVDHVAFEGEDHTSVVPAAFSRALTFALAPKD